MTYQDWNADKLKTAIRIASSWPIGLTRTEEKAYREKHRPRIEAWQARLDELQRTS